MKRWTAGVATVTLLTATTPALVAWGANPELRAADREALPAGLERGGAVAEIGPRGASTGVLSGAGLVADVNRDGALTGADEGGEDRWTAGRGAIFLANLDDDEERCRVDPGRLNEIGRAFDDELAACNDAADERINGARDAADLAPLKVVAQGNLCAGATGRITVSPVDKARVFVDGVAGGELGIDALRTGVRVGLEGRDIVRDPAKWDGQITVTLTVTDRGRSASDVVRMRVAPLMLQNDLQRAETVLAAKPNEGPGWWGESPYPQGVPAEWEPFAKSLGKATRSTGARLNPVQGTPEGWKDLWQQDTFEPATASMPAKGGAQVMRVMIRSGNVWDFYDQQGKPVATPRPAGRLLYRELRGPDVAVVQELADVASPGMDDLLNMGGNIESLPPYAGYPQGRIVYGSGERHPDPGFIKMVTGQGFQPSVVIDTSWLVVGHADETTHVVRADNRRGWTLAVADPRLAVELLRDAHRKGAGAARLAADTTSPSKPTVDEVLADSNELTANESAARHIDDQLEILLKATGLRRSELVRLPVLFAEHESTGLLRAMTPGLVNGLSLTSRDFAAPDPHGPKVGGRDIFRDAARQALARDGVRVHWVEDYFWAHLAGGEVHCATNALRQVRPAWWRE